MYVCVFFLQKPAAAKHNRHLVSDRCTQWSKCKITLHYFGPIAASLDSPEWTGSMSHLDSVVVQQQCCGTNMRTVFHGNVAPKSM